MTARSADSLPAVQRVAYSPVEGAAALFTTDFLDYVVALHDEFTPRVRAVRERRAGVLRRALQDGVLPGPLPRTRDRERAMGGPACPRRPAQARHRDLRPLLDHQHVHQRPQPRAGGRAGRGRSRRRRGFGRAPAGRHRPRRPQPAGGGESRADLRGPRAEPHVPDRRWRAAVLHAPRARAPPRRTRVPRGRPPHPGRHPGDGPDALLRRARPGPARARDLLLPAQARVRRGVRLAPRPPGSEPPAPAVPPDGDHQRHPPRRVPPRRVPDGRDAPRPRPVRGRAQRRALGSQGQHLRVRHGRLPIGVARPLRGRHQDHAVPRRHLPAAGGDLPPARRGPHRRHGHRAAERRPRGEPGGRRGHPRRQGMGGPARLHSRLGRPHLPHEARGRALQAAARGGLGAAPGDARSRPATPSASRSRPGRSPWRGRGATPAWSSSISRDG